MRKYVVVWCTIGGGHEIPSQRLLDADAVDIAYTVVMLSPVSDCFVAKEQLINLCILQVSVAGVAATDVALAGEMRLAGVLPPEGTPTGKISVLSSRFFFGFGSGAAR